MGYPYDKTYLETIKENEYDCKRVREAFWILVSKYKRENKVEELTITEFFQVLGEAFEYESSVLESCNDAHHFMWDVLDELLGQEKL